MGVLIAVLLTYALWSTMGDLVRNYSDLPGTDTYWHVTLAGEAFDRFTAGQPIGPISESINAGTSYLYDTGGTYPQFTYWALLAVSVVVDSTPRAFAIMMFVAMALAQLSFFFGFKNRYGVTAAAFGAVVFGYAPFLLTNVGVQHADVER
jgi:hypothetical protein